MSDNLEGKSSEWVANCQRRAPSEAHEVKFPTMPDETVHDTAFGPVKIITDCRALKDYYYNPGELCGPHTCTEANPCDTRP